MKTAPKPLPLIAAAFLLVTGCTQSSDDEDTGAGDAEASASSASGTSSSTISVSGTGWLTVGSDGAVQTTFFDVDGRYRDLRNGSLFAGGTWEQRGDGTICFEPDAGLGACWKPGSADENGTAIATNSESKSIAIKQVTFIAAPADESEEAIGN
ncbi:MAG: hypothetical protein AAF697_03890 [Pseudomonadota bacterium]